MNENEQIVVTEDVNKVVDVVEPYVYDLPEEEHKTNKVAVGIGVSLLTAALTGGLLLWRKHKKKKAAEAEECDDYEDVDYEEIEDEDESSDDEDEEDSEEESKPKSNK